MNTTLQHSHASPPRRALKSLRSRAGGFTMMEVLIAILVLAVGLLGLAGMQAAGIKNNANANLRTQASILAYDMIDRMRANATLAVGGAYNVAVTDAAPTTNDTLAKQDLIQWLGDLAAILPSGDGIITVNSATRLATVTVQWTERDVGNASGVTKSFQYSSRL